MNQFSVILPAAGSGSRSGHNQPKQYVELLGEPVLRHTLCAFHTTPGCMEIVVAIDSAWRAEAEACAVGMPNVRFVDGGAERQHSIANALAALQEQTELVLVHDAARPCVSPMLIARVLDAARQYGAAIPALPIAETVKEADSEGKVVRTVPRAGLYTVQTPQGFQRELLEQAYAHARQQGIVGTDDAALVEAYGSPVMIVEGEPENIKITYPADFERAEETVRRLRQQNAG